MFAYYTTCICLYRDFIPTHSSLIDILYKNVYKKEKNKWPKPSQALGIIRFYHKGEEITSDADLQKHFFHTEDVTTALKITFSMEGIEEPDSVFVDIVLK